MIIPAKIESSTNIPTRQNNVESIAEWFNQHKQSFYMLGWAFLRNQQEIEKLFYLSILKVHKEFPKYKNETSFEKWVTSIFLKICRELSIEESLQAPEEPRLDLFKALDQLSLNEKEAMALTNLKGFTREDAAHLLHVSEEKLKEHLFSGIQSLKKGLGNGQSLNGCKEYHKDYLDYLERTLDRKEKVAFEIHIYQCPNCQEDLAAFQDVMLTLFNVAEGMEDFQVPSGFMENVNARLAEEGRHRQLKKNKRIRLGIVFASILALLIGLEVLTGSFTNLYYSYTEEDPELRAFYHQGLGKRLNLEAESNGVKIRIRSAIADDVQTLIFYEIEDTAEENQYMVGYEGYSVKDQYKIMSHIREPRYLPPNLETEANKKDKNVFRGKLSLLPLNKNHGTIRLEIKNLQKLIRDSSAESYENPALKTGVWNFKIPITKHPSIEYALDKETKVEGVPVRFEKLTIAPTTTILQYAINHERPQKRIEFLTFDRLKVNDKKVKADNFGSSMIESQPDNWTSFQANFDPLYGEKPKEVNVRLNLAFITVEEKKTIGLDASWAYPQTFEYAGSKISIDKFEAGPPSKVVISNHEIKNRAYESLRLDFFDGDGNGMSTTENDNEGVIVDKSGKEYDRRANINFQKVDHPRYFTTVQTFELDSTNTGENGTPNRLEIYGYNTTKFLNDVVKISLK